MNTRSPRSHRRWALFLAALAAVTSGSWSSGDRPSFAVYASPADDGHGQAPAEKRHQQHQNQRNKEPNQATLEDDRRPNGLGQNQKQASPNSAISARDPVGSSTLNFLAGLNDPPTNGPHQIGDAHCTMEDLERANDSQLHSILTELKATNFFKSFVVDLDHKCPLSTWGGGGSGGSHVGPKGAPDQKSKLKASSDPQQKRSLEKVSSESSFNTNPGFGFGFGGDDGNCAGGGEEFDDDGDLPCKVETDEEEADFTPAQADEDDAEPEFECDGGKDELDDDAEPLCTVQGGDDAEGAFGGFGGAGGSFSSLSTAKSNLGQADAASLGSNALQHLVDDGFSSQEHQDTFQWNSQTDIVVESDDGEEPPVLCDLPETFWMDMCSNIGAGETTKVVNLQLNPERNTGYNGTHIWRAIYEENCISVSGSDAETCLEERVLYRLLSGLHTSTTVSIAKNYYPPSKRKNRTNWEPNPKFFMEKFQSHPEYIRNLHFSYVVMMRAIHKAAPYLRNYDIQSGNTIEDKAATVLLHRLLDSAILQSCSNVFTAFDETAMFKASGDDVVALQQNFKGVFHNISSILDCVQCQQCKLHGKMAMLGYGTALKVLFLPSNLLVLERNEVVALINTIVKLSDSLTEVKELTHMYWRQAEEEKKLQEEMSPTYITSTAPVEPTLSPFGYAGGSDEFALMDNAVGLVASLARAKRITQDRETELVQMALKRHPELLILAKHYHSDASRFLSLSSAIGAYGAEGTVEALPDAVIVGTGLAGLSAALNILDRGGSVVLLEKEHLLGGNSNKASSGINGCCPQGDKYGDSLDSFRNDTIRSAGEVADLPLIETLVGKSEKAVNWLKSRVGVDLSLMAQLGGHSYKRTHRPNNGMAGAEIIYHIQKAVKSYSKRGRLTLLVDTRVTQLLTDDKTGRVTGVKCETKDGDTKDIFADNVVLATGGFAADRSEGSYLEQHRPELLGMPATAGSFSTGDGISLATAIGANVRDMEKVQLHPTGWVDPSDPKNPSKILAAELMRGVGGMLINRDGKRFCNELGTRAYVTDKMLSHNPSYAKTKKWDASAEIPTFHLVLSSSAAEDGKKHVKLYTHKGLLTKVEGIDQLAAKMGLSKRAVSSTIQSYQKAAAKGVDEFGKTSFRGVPMQDLSKEIFYVGSVTPVLHYCMGGITIDTEGNVLRADGSQIFGLHAAGEVTGGVHGNNRLGGNSLLECTVFGTIVGQKLPVKAEASSGRPADKEARKTEEQDIAFTQLPVITLEELSKHNTPDDLWVAIHGIVYDFTDFADEHPAGAQSIYDLAGTDGTAAFAAVHNENLLEDFEEEKKGILETLSDDSNNTESKC